ncbi:MAG: efflux transporter periplasmic adaptor subunit [Rhodobacteraceae bacterium PARR1]|nr:MAG: efflux transporter periplasmic adaptor subunit [Rhodobacteraceae bacterium PARR1]
MTAPATQSPDLSAILARTKGKRRRWPWVVALVLALTAGAGWWWQGQAASPGITYTTEAASIGSLNVTVTATGSVQPTTQVDVSSELSGTLATVEVDFNDPVTVGQVLARLDDTKVKAQRTNAEAQLTGAKARLAQAEASAAEAEANLTQQQELDRRGVSARQSLVSFQAAAARATAAVDIARADLTLAEANLELAIADVEKTVLRSPVNGIVLNRAVEAGQIVASSLNTPVLFTLAEDLTRMELRVDVDEADIGRVAVGQKAVFTVDAHPDRSFPATITQVRQAPEETDNIVTYKAILSVDNPEGLLRPGMTATAVITVSERADALLVPNAALRYAPPVQETASSGGRGLIGFIMPRGPRGGDQGTGTGRSVWVLQGGTPVEVAVNVMDSDGSHSAVTSDDLSEGDAIITDQSSAR